MKQEQLKVALCGYYPHEVKVEYKLRSDSNFLVDDFNEKGVTNLRGDFLDWMHEFELIKPILYNISTLTKPIIVKGYNGGLPFVPIDELLKKCVYTGYTAEFINRVSIGQKMLSTFATGEILDYLNRWKLDYRNLIGQGLAIDVETLKENCYE